ncbi:DUF2651 family protein [Brevibacillus laterosporus]|uniref:DUF2651 family protein n=1 Tax=Brevibacillus laterosporus TaxID=1465 RepID=UPI0020CB79D8|nr:DUF2651 family protein [Brevibacillus laterosporus]
MDQYAYNRTGTFFINLSSKEVVRYVSEFLLVLFYFPIAVGILTIIGTLIWKRFYVMPVGTFLFFTILTYTYFGDTFFMWSVVYAGLSLFVSLMTSWVYHVFLRNK